jgi:hypothetical protein
MKQLSYICPAVALKRRFWEYGLLVKVCHRIAHWSLPFAIQCAGHVAGGSACALFD